MELKYMWRRGDLCLDGNIYLGLTKLHMETQLTVFITNSLLDYHSPAVHTGKISSLL